MNPGWLALTGIVHGSVGAAVLALLALAVWLERRGERASFGSSLLFASLLQALQLVLGAVQHAGYERHLKLAVMARLPVIGWWLQRKEHLAVGAACLVWAALASWWVGQKAEDLPWAPGFSRSAAVSARLAAALCLVVFTLGAIVAAGIDHAVSK